MAEDNKTTPHNYPTHLENFEVVLIKKGVSDLSAKPEDFKRVPVQASNPLQAQTKDEAQVDGYHVLFAAKPGVLTDPEIMANRRAIDPPTDPTKL
jgi:hypothetical protein